MAPETAAALHKIFNKFAGAEMKDPYRGTRDHDPVQADILNAAYENGLTVRFIRAGKSDDATDDHVANRVNIHLAPLGVDVHGDVRYRVGKMFYLG